MRFEWNEKKNRTNIEKHGIDFANAWEIFHSPLLTALDTRNDYGEERWIGIGDLKGRVVVMVFTEPTNDKVRIISIRKAVKYERVQYEKALKDGLG